MIKIIVCLTLPFIFFSCKESDSNKPVHQQKAHEFEKIIKKENLELKECFWDEDSKQFSFHIYAPSYLAGIEEAREKLYLLSNDFLNLLNSNEWRNFPEKFTISNLKITIEFKNYIETKILLSKAKLNNKKFKYFVFTKEINTQKIKEESYEEAKEIVEKMLNTPKPPPLNEALANRISFQAGEKIKKAKNLHLAGIGGSWHDQRKCLRIDFSAYFLSDINTARELLVFCIQEFLKELNTSQEMKEALGHEFTIDNIEIVIFFKEDKNYDPNRHIRVASLNNFSDKTIINYKTEYSDFGPFDIVKEETYEEALKIVNSF